MATRLMTTALAAWCLLLGALGCESGGPATADDQVVRVRIDGNDYFLELALDNESRVKGLSEREYLDPDGGMLFVFRDAAPRAFVMRDCFIPIDIIYLDGAGLVVAMHHMPIEPPRDPEQGEGQIGDTNNVKYEQRLKKYPSRFDTQFVIELAGGELEKLDISEGDKIDLDTVGLKRRAR